MLNKSEYGAPSDATPLLIAHGLFGSARNLGVIAKRLSKRRQVSAVDMRNHGASPWFDTNSYGDMAGDLAAEISQRSDVLGHSMGGKASMILALQHSEKVRKLVIADIAPVEYSHTQAHLIKAMSALDLSSVETRGDADRQLQRHIEEPGVRAFLLQSLDVKEKRWRINLDVLEAEMDKIIGFPDVSGQFDGPTLFLSGTESDYVRPEHRSRIKRTVSKSRFCQTSRCRSLASCG